MQTEESTSTTQSLQQTGEATEMVKKKLAIKFACGHIEERAGTDSSRPQQTILTP
jgi:hypothetical protein